MPLTARSPLAPLGVGVLALSLLGASAVSADEDPPGYEVVADGLNNPRHLSFSGTGDLFVAEAGTGGTDGPYSGPEGEAYFGLTGSVTRVRGDLQERVITGLPSLASDVGANAIGPTDVSVQGPQRYAVSMGLGADPAARTMISGAERMATLLTGTFASMPRVTADLGAYEADANPDGDLPDSNPGGFVATPGGYVAVDAGGNSLLAVSASGNVSTLAWFPEREVQNPFAPPGVMLSMDAVPTSVVVGPDGAYYVSQLTGFPFPAGGSIIWRVVPGEDPEPYATGLSTVTDLAWNGDDLYAVQLTDTGLLGGPPGSLVKVGPMGDHEVVAGGLMFPYGVAIRDDAAYVTIWSVAPGMGAVIKVSLG
ncbi:MAG: ScyD/ScyE family protein [Actinomycetales bacterium]|jgi:hypothetical protein|nr:ScyD/ScyE family protein [Actinomycetales bacterium]